MSSYPERAPSRRRVLAGLGALAAASLGAAGCGKSRRVDGRVAASLWFAYGGKNREVLLQLVTRFNQAQSRYVIVPTYQGDYFEALAKTRTALAAGVPPTFTHVVGEVMPYLARAGVLEPLDGYEGASSIRFVPALGQRGAYAGGEREPLVGIPFNRSTPILFGNKRMLEAAGRAMPTTWDELRATARALTERSAGATRWGFEVPVDWWFWVALVGQAGGAVVDEAGKATLGGEAGERALRLWQELVHTDRVMRPPPGRDYNAWQATNQDFLSGRAALIETSTAFLRYLEENAKFPVVAAPLPAGIRRAAPTGGTFFVMLRGAPPEEKQAAWAFLRFMCETQQTIDWATRTGYLPVTLDAVQKLRDDGYYEKHPNDQVALDQLADVQPWPWSPGLFRIQREVVSPRLESAVLENRDVAAVLADARREAAEP